MIADAAAASRRSLRRLLPVLLIALILSGMLLFVLLVVMPTWREYEALTAEIADLHDQIEQQTAASADPEIMQARIDNARETLQTSADTFVTEAQADTMLESLYGYAGSSSVMIVSLQAQQLSEETPEAYNVRAFRLEVGGNMPQLLQFVTSIREATIPAVQISSLSVSGDIMGYTLTMDMVVYTSPFASGSVTEVLAPAPSRPAIVMNTSTPAAPFAATADPLATPAAGAVLPTGVPTLAPAQPAAFATATAISAQSSSTRVPVTPLAGGTNVINACPGAPPTLFSPGDVVVVDFNMDTRLNILSGVRAPQGNAVRVLTQAPDNAVLTLIDGPVCGNWRGMSLWYWYADYGGMTGWVGEGTVLMRWLCPADNPECAS